MRSSKKRSRTWLGAGGDADGALPPGSGRGNAQSLARGDPRQALKNVAAPAPSPDLALEIVVGLMLQALSAFAERRVSRDDLEPTLAALLRALGADGPANPVDLGALAKAGVDVESGPAGAATAGRPRDGERRAERPRPPVRGLAV